MRSAVLEITDRLDEIAELLRRCLELDVADMAVRENVRGAFCGCGCKCHMLYGRDYAGCGCDVEVCVDERYGGPCGCIPQVRERMAWVNEKWMWVSAA